MIFNRETRRTGIKVLVLLAVLIAVELYGHPGVYGHLVIFFIITAFYIFDSWSLRKKIRGEIFSFVDAARYRDFTRFYGSKTAPLELKLLREGFNELNETFKQLSRDRELHYQYLQSILDVVDTSIFCFDTASGEVLWMNESFKRTVHIPYIKTIAGLRKRRHDLAGYIENATVGAQEVVPANVEGRTLRLLLSATVFQANGHTYKLTALQKINEALNESEANAWQKLLSVMTHEIMNSITPIASLADTLKTRLDYLRATAPVEQETLEDIRAGIDTIKSRSAGLLRFTANYRNLSKITAIHVEPVRVRTLFDNIRRLLMPTLLQKQVDLDIILPDEDIIFHADNNLVEQMLINLLLNAIDALDGRPDAHITLTAQRQHDGQLLMQVADNGAGISPDVLENIFVPFFTTKKTGSGIGLSLCRQIMTMHKGSIEARSTPGEGSVFDVRF